MSAFPAFCVAVGEEGSDPLVLHDGEVVRVDEYGRSGHLDHLASDVADVADLGISHLRHGMPWQQVERSPGRYDWRLWDEAAEAWEAAGIEPIVDLLHFGLPDHLVGFTDRRLVGAFCDYVEAFLDRYDRPTLFTPVNEPGITAMMSGLLGIWNDRLASHEAYAACLVNVCLANLEAMARISEDREAAWIGSEGFGAYLVAGPELEAEAQGRRAIEQLVWDLQLGVEPPAEAEPVARHIAPEDADRLADLSGRLPALVAGHDFYPASTQLVGQQAEPTIADRVAAYRAEATRWHQRYRRDFWVAETSNLGLPVDEQVAWLDALSTELEAMADDGLPVRGICWYSRQDQYDWHTALTVPIGEVTEVGLFDATRRARPSAAAISALAARHAGR